MKYDVERPTALVDLNRLAMRKSRSFLMAVCVWALVTNSEVAYHPLVSAGYPLLSRAILAVPVLSCAIKLQRAETCCKAHGACISMEFVNERIVLRDVSSKYVTLHASLYPVTLVQANHQSGLMVQLTIIAVDLNFRFKITRPHLVPEWAVISDEAVMGDAPVVRSWRNSLR